MTTYEGTASVPGWGHKTYEVEAFSLSLAMLRISAAAAEHTGQHPASITISEVRKVNR